MHLVKTINFSLMHVVSYLAWTMAECPADLLGTVLRFGVKVAVVRYLNFSKNAINGFNMQFKLILNVFCQKIDKVSHISAQFYTKSMTRSLSNCLKWQICY